MVNGIGFNSNVGQYSKDIENVVKYSAGTAIVANEESPFSGMGLLLGIGGAQAAWGGGAWLLNNRKGKGLNKDGVGIKQAWANYGVEAEAKSQVFKDVGGFGKKEAWKLASAQHNEKLIMDAIPKGDKFTKLTEVATNGSEKAQKAQKAIKNYKAAQNMAKYSAENALKNPTRAKLALKIANKRLANAESLAHGTVEATGFFGKLFSKIGKFTGLSKLNGAMKNLATKSPLTAKLLKHGKGNGIFLAITAGVELFTQVIPTFAQLGFEKGLKQIGKSIAKTAASIGGWIVGSAVGTEAGAIMGAAIGTFIPLPGVGTVVGGFVGGLCGMIGGCIGAWAATKATSKIIGKDELELDKEKQAETLTKEITKQASEYKDTRTLQEVATAAAQRLQQEGIDTPDAKVAFGSLKKLAALQSAPADNTKVAQNAPQDTTGQAQQPSFNGSATPATNPLQANPFNQGATANPYAAQFKMNSNFNQQQDYMDQDFMAMSVGLK